MNKYIFRGLALCFFTATIVSCKKQLEISPRQSIDASTALNSKDAIEASITAIYARFKSARLYGRDLIAVSEALADNGFATNKSGRLLPEAQNNQGNTVTTNHFTTTIWTSGYGGINQINLTLEAIPKLAGITAVESDRWQGQLYFLRALCYFEMMKAYAYIPGAVVTAQDRGGVPIITKGIQTADFALTFLPARPPIDDVYKLIVDDFTIANTKLLNTAAGVATSIASKAAAQAMLARVNLYTKNFAEAKRWSDSCINLVGSRLTTTANYVAGWRAEHQPEALFQIRFATAGENIGVNESIQTSYTTLVTPGNTAVTGGFGDLVPSITLLNELGILLAGGNTTTNFALPASIGTRSTDVRNLIFEPGTSGRGNAKVECTKFTGRSGALNLDNVPVIRIAEVYLIRAEAQATAGSSVLNLVNALADLKAIKSKRYTDYTGSAQELADNASTQPVLLDEILRQRRIELAFEGQRFFDLKRLGKDLVKAPHYNTVAFTDTRILAPILQADVDGNPNLKQNLGY
jgi:starch-binding outer membrane protein, SusD/RagB family